MRLAVVDDATKIVLNVIEADENFPAAEGTTHVASEEAGIGDTYVVREKSLLFKASKKFVKSEVTEQMSPREILAAASTNTKKINAIVDLLWPAPEEPEGI